MKKFKLRGKELYRLGYPAEGKASGVAINVVLKHFKRSDKAEVLDLLKAVLDNPAEYAKDPVLGQIAVELMKPEKRPFREIRLHEQPLDYKIFGKNEIEPGAIQQMETAMRLPISLKGALMPDAHQGYGLPIGGVLAADNAVIPYGVGMDIGCRMCLTVFDLKPKYINQYKGNLKRMLVENTYFGKKDLRNPPEHEVMDRQEFKEIKFLKEHQQKAWKQLGSSGGGNHFVDIGIVDITDPQNAFNVEPGEYMGILSHSGSRKLGASIAQHYTRLAKETCKLPKGAVSLAWFDMDSAEGQEYWIAMNLAGDYAKANHDLIHERMEKSLKEKPLFKVENHHNFAWKEPLENGKEAIIHRKGATPAHEGDLGIIPGSMTTPGFIVRGKGNPGSLYSASHGAGRVMSRGQAKQRFTKKDLTQALEKAGVTLIGGGTDEAPMAYKDIRMVMQYQEELVDVLGIFYPKIAIMSGD